MPSVTEPWHAKRADRATAIFTAFSSSQKRQHHAHTGAVGHAQ
ncbi:hypothetical protein [Moraxella lacunata]